MGVRRQVVSALDRSGALSVLHQARASVASPWITALTYHRASIDSLTTDLDEGVIDVTPEELETQVAFLAQYFSFIGVDDLARHFYQGAPLPKNPVLLTFDDGYRDNLLVALPILQRHGARGVFFVATDYVERRRLFWWDRVNLMVKRSKREFITLRTPARETIALGPTDRARSLAIWHLLRLIKDVPALDLDRYFDDLAEATGVSFTPEEERALVDRHLLTWDEIRSLQRAGMDVQSHTRTHRVLHTLSDADLWHELGDARRELSAQLGIDVTALAYPVGPKPDRRVLSAVRAAGYKLAFTNASGASARVGADPLRLRRLCMDLTRVGADFRAVTAIPLLGHYL